MSLKQEIETWVDALNQYDNNEFEESLKTFDGISDTSKILFNCGVIHATLGEHDKAVECYQRAVGLDKYLAVAYFQQGVSNFLVGDFEEALANFNDTLLYLRGNTYIDYEQLGLKFKLYSCEVLFNRGLCYIYLQQKDTGMTDLSYAVKEKVTPDHDVIDDAIAEEAEGYTVFSIPVGIVYRPNPAKVKNLKAKDYLGKARLVASTEQGNAFTGFAGTARQPVITENVDDRPAEAISFAASNLVRNDITSRSMRQQSEPPANRNVFPPTPPPENEAPVRPGIIKSATMPIAPPSATEPPPRTARANSVRNGPMGGSISRSNTRRYGPPASIREDEPFSPGSAYPAPMRPGTMRTASEPRGPSRQYSQRSYRDGPPSSRNNNNRLFMEARRGEDDEIDEYPDELYDMYRGGNGNEYAGGNPYGNSRSLRRQDSRQDSRYGGTFDRDSGGSSLDDFEMMNETLPRRGMSTRQNTRGSESSSGDVRQVRVKMHHEDETRYIMCSTNIDFDGFQDKVREKLGLRNRMRIKIKDEGDLITIGDPDDWDMQVVMARKQARRVADDMARMEVWVHEV